MGDGPIMKIREILKKHLALPVGPQNRGSRLSHLTTLEVDKFSLLPHFQSLNSDDGVPNSDADGSRAVISSNTRH